jgi:2-polyprenyl-3-methyl-5-hydroxy-6-metoxy-1,4-benzoquinol methylase
MRCFLQAFSATDKAVLIMKMNPGAAGAAAKALEDTRRQFPSRARVELRCEAWDEKQIATLHRRGDCYLSLHRGEGWCYPLFEAACNGTPVVATAYSGPLDYLDQEHHQLVPYRLTPVCQPYMYYHRRMNWAEPDAAQAAAKLRWVFENQEAAKQKAAEAATCLRRRYANQEVGSLVKNRLLALLEHTNRTRWERIRNADRARRPRPPVPIPADWYDADYFENGITSNWDCGYTWPLFAGVFRETAAYLSTLFNDARSFLDLGCAKGFLVRCLRESGRECWGFDFSRWAVEHADESARPFVQLASVDDIAFERRFDLLLAFEVFAHLTEEQVRSFLRRARPWIRTAFLATIPCFASDNERSQYQASDQDLSHITLRSRDWWHQLFLQAGWSAAHSDLQRACQDHPLPRKMGWKVFVYRPEENLRP